MIYEEDINYDILLLLQLLFEQISSLKPTSGPYEHVYMYIHIYIHTLAMKSQNNISLAERVFY